MAAFEAKHLRGAGHVAVILIEFLQDVIALVSVASLMKRGEFAFRCAAAAVAIDQRGQMLAVEASGGGIHDYDALDDIAQLAHVARPGITHEHVNGIVGDLTGTPAIGRRKFLEEVASEKGDVFLALAQWRNEEWNHVQPVKEIFAESCPAKSLLPDLYS